MCYHTLDLVTLFHRIKPLAKINLRINKYAPDSAHDCIGMAMLASALILKYPIVSVTRDEGAVTLEMDNGDVIAIPMDTAISILGGKQ